MEINEDFEPHFLIELKSVEKDNYSIKVEGDEPSILMGLASLIADLQLEMKISKENIEDAIEIGFGYAESKEVE